MNIRQGSAILYNARSIFFLFMLLFYEGEEGVGEEPNLFKLVNIKL